MSRLVSILLAGLVVWAGVAAAIPPSPAAASDTERSCGCAGCNPASCCCLDSAPADLPHPLEALPAASAPVFHPFEYLSAGGETLLLPECLEVSLPAPAFSLPLPGRIALFERDCAWLI